MIPGSNNINNELEDDFTKQEKREMRIYDTLESSIDIEDDIKEEEYRRKKIEDILKYGN